MALVATARSVPVALGAGAVRAVASSARRLALLPFRGTGWVEAVRPFVADSAFVARSADLIGRVTVEEAASVWYQCVLRGDSAAIHVGRGSNIQDGTVVHVASAGLSGGERGTVIGADCTVGHQALLHACTLHDRAFVGMQACIMDGVVIESDAMVAAGSLVTAGKVVKSGELWGGRPARLMRTLTTDEVAFILRSARHYQQLASEHITTAVVPESE